MRSDRAAAAGRVRRRARLGQILAAGSLLAAGLPASAPGRAGALTLARMFATPDLSGPTLRAPQFSQDSRLVAYLEGSSEDKDRLDLWAYDVATRERRILVAARALAPRSERLSAEEAARRERQRTSSLGGILEFQFSPDSRSVLVPLDGGLYLYDLTAPAAHAVRRIGAPTGSLTDARFSPRGHFVSFVRDGNLYVHDLAGDREERVTPECREPVLCGMAEFVAQEEMDRFTGYWWSPDESRIAWTRVDESPVPVHERVEIDADDVRVVRQRYPAAGEPNARVQLFVSTVAAATPGAGTAPAPGHPAAALLATPFAAVEIPFAAGGNGPAGGAATAAGTAASPEYYLARVDWFPDSRSLAVQRQSRDQKTLDLLRAGASGGAIRPLLSEHSDTWVELNDELTFLRAGAGFLWASSRTGYRHLYLYDLDGRLIRPLTAGEWMVVGSGRGRAIRGIDAKRGLVYFEANRESVLERHLYVASYAQPGAPIVRLTSEPGWHEIQMSQGAGLYLDRWSTAGQPPSVTLHAATGKRLGELVANRLDAQHPYGPYLDTRPDREFGTLAAEDGQTLHYELTLPRRLAAGQRHPVVVEVYGGPGVQFVANQWADQAGFFEHLLAERGYVVFKLDNRGSGERGTRFETTLYRQLGIAEVRDQVRGVEFLKTLPYVDPARIGVFGWSYGGYLALMCLLQAPQAFAAGIAGAPVTDWRRYDTHYTERYLGTPAENPRGYELADVLTYADRLRAPLLLVHGMADDNVLFTHSTALMKRLQDLGMPFELMTYPGAKHSLLRHADSGPHAYGTILRFLDEKLGAPNAAP